MPLATARSMLSLGMEVSRAFWIASARAGFPSGSPPPSRAATVIARVSFVNSAPRLASTAFFLCLIEAHFECPAMAFKSMAKKPMSSSSHARPQGEPQQARSTRTATRGTTARCPISPRESCGRRTGLLGAAVLVAAGLGPRARGAWRSAWRHSPSAWGLFSLFLAARGRGMSVGPRALVTATTHAGRRALALGHGRRHQLHPAGDDLHRAVHLVLLPAAPGLAADGAVRLRVRDAALLRRPGPSSVGYPARLAMFALAVAGSMVAIQFLKGRLVRAESHQRAMAELDPLTGRVQPARLRPGARARGREPRARTR